MTLLAVERIKLLSTRSPWWCMAGAFMLPVGMTGIAPGPTLAEAEYFTLLGMVMMMVMAALAVTTEYRFSTIRVTFAAVPRRGTVLLAKVTVVALLAGAIGELTGFACFALSRLLRPNAGLALATLADWRTVAGVGAVWALAAVIAVAVAILVRHTAGAVSLLLVYTLLVENLVTLIPRVGPAIGHWLPFTAATHFRVAGQAIPASDAPGLTAEGIPYGPWTALAYLAGIAAALFIIAMLTARRRDA